MDLRIQRSVVSTLRTRPGAIEVGPFVAGFDPGTDSPYVNYASPRPGASITAGDIQALIAAFAGAGRKPRLEYVISSAPDLENMLLAAGFTVEARHQYLICTVSTLTAPAVPAEAHLAEPGTDRERAALAATLSAAFGAPAATGGEVAGIRRTQENGGVAVAALTGGACVGGGQAMPPGGGVSEVAGIGVREAFRGRGLGGAITAEVTRLAFQRGAEIAWLEAGGADSWRVYERVGYVPAGHRLYIGKD